MGDEREELLSRRLERMEPHTRAPVARQLVPSIAPAEVATTISQPARVTGDGTPRYQCP